MFRLKSVCLFVIIITFTFISGCVKAPTEQGSVQNSNGNNDEKIKIGFAMATIKEERWQKDKKHFEEYCKTKENVECVVTVANANADTQANDVDNLLTQGVDVLVVAPHDATQAASMVDKAKAQKIPVISYDRLILSDKIDLYISHQVPVIGRKIAEYALQKVPKGNYVMVYGDSGDNNAMILKREMNAVLKDAIDKKEIKIVADQHAKDWKLEESLKIVENALTQNNDKVDAVVASNDGTAGGAVQALETKGLTGKVLVTGQDAEKAALQRIAEGKQTMTIYKPIKPLAERAVDAAIKLAKGEKTDSKPFENDGKTYQAILLEIIVVDKENLMDTVVKDGWITFEDLFANVSEDKRPKKE